MTSCTLATDERISLITTIFADHVQVEMVGNLSGDDGQAFIDMIDEVSSHKISYPKDVLVDLDSQPPHSVGQALDSLEPQIRRKCLSYLRRICGRQALLPRSLMIPPCFDAMENPLCSGRFADTWKGQYQGQEVAAKVLRAYSRGDFEWIRRVS